MIFNRLLPHTVGVITPTETTDRYGDVSKVYDAANAEMISAYVQPNESDEATDQRDAVLYEYKVFSNAPVRADNRVIYDGRTYEVDGDAKRWDTPRGFSHYEFKLKKWEG